jgi:hypothetical protein
MKQSRLTFALLFLSFITVETFGQGTLTFEGEYESGKASYEYIEGDMQQRLLNGKFQYEEVREIATRDGENEILVTGNYINDKKHLAWGYTIKSLADTGMTESIIGNYLEGQKSGLWTHRIRTNADDKEMKVVQASFIKNQFRGPFKYSFENPVSVNIKKLTVTGSFDAKGLMDGDWNINYTNGIDEEFKDVMKFQHGVIAYRSFHNMTKGEVLESVNDVDFVNSFFINMDRLDSSSVVDEKKYGSKSKAVDHPILKEVFGVWTTLSTNINNEYNASIPNGIIKKGEVVNQQTLAVNAEIIDWKETPKGKLEFEKEQAIKKAYDTKINVANIQFDQKNYRQALPLYKEAIAIKNESFANKRISEIEEFLRIEEEKKQFITAINSRYDLWKGNEKMLASEDYYGKKNHLYEASIIALDYEKKQLLTAHQETRAFIERRAMDELSIEALRGFQTALDEVIRLQDQIKALTKREDTKELEKTLKKMEDPGAISKTIMAG